MFIHGYTPLRLSNNIDIWFLLVTDLKIYIYIYIHTEEVEVEERKRSAFSFSTSSYHMLESGPSFCLPLDEKTQKK